MSLALAWLAVLLGPTLLGAGAILGWRLLHPAVDRALARLARRRPARPVGPPIEQIAADVRRLRAELVALDRQSRPGKALRVRAVRMAYDDALHAACVALEVPGADELLTTTGRAHDSVVAVIEAGLFDAGLDVDPASHRR